MKTPACLPIVCGVLLALRAVPASAEVLAQPTGGLSVDVSQREQSRLFYNTIYQASEGVPSGWTGSLSSGTPGTTTQAFRDATLLRVKYFRTLAGVPAAVTFADALNSEAQQAALMMSANQTLSHFPPSTWLDYTAAGAEAASASDLALGQEGPTAVSGYLEDPGSNNSAAGHRRWLLYPPTTTMGTGDVDGDATHESANALWVVQTATYGTPTATRDGFVAWPPPGFLPYQVVFPRWSFSYPAADFSQATVTMQRNGQTVPLRLETPANAAGDNSLVWVPDGLSTDGNSTPVGAAVSADTPYAVTVDNVLIDGSARTFTYHVTVFDPAQPGADTVLPTLTNPAAGTYQFNAVPGATGYQWTARAATPLTTRLDAENGVGDATMFPAGTQPVVSTDGQDGTACYQLNSGSEMGAPGGPIGTDTYGESLTLNAPIFPAADSTLQFVSRLGLHADDEQALVQVSTDDGAHWTTVYQQTGPGDPEAAFSTKTVDLSAYAATVCRVRFAFVAPNVGSYYPRNPITGWFLDDILCKNVLGLGAAATTTLPDDSLGFTWAAPDAGTYALQVTPLFFGGYPAELKAGKASKTIKIVPLGDAGDGTSKRQVKLTLQPGTGYTVDANAGAAKVKIVH